MKRQEFIAGFITTVAAWPAIAKQLPDITAGKFVSPPYLKKGDTIGITSPGGYIKTADIQPAIKEIERWGYNVHIGDTIDKRDNTFGGTDAERIADMQAMLDNGQIKAILCARGGYGSVRIIDALNWDRFKASPKWIIGFSDVTVLHAHLSRQLHIASIHSKMCNSFPAVWETANPLRQQTILSIGQALSGEKMSYSVSPASFNKTGKSEGILVGGNLKTLESLAGSASAIETDNRILFVEDTGEYMYSIDRMFWNLKRSGKLDRLKGLIIGGFKIKKDDPGEEFGKTLQEVVLEKVKEFHYPVCFNFPVGHQLENFALKCGVMHRLEVSDTRVLLQEI